MTNISENRIWIEEAWPNYEQVRAGHNGRFVTIHNPELDSFIKVDTHPNGVWLQAEVELIKSSVMFANSDLTDSEVERMIFLEQVDFWSGGSTSILHSSRLGINVRDAINLHLLELDRIPYLAAELLETSNRLFSQTGYFNLDLNPTNILVNFPNEGLIIIDWVNHSRSKKLSVSTIATALNKFINPFVCQSLPKESFVRAMERPEYVDVLAELENRNIFLF